MSSDNQKTTDYQAAYDKYWVDESRIGSTSTRLQSIAEMVVATCGGGRTLDVGSGEGVLVSELLKLGVDAYGFDVSEVAVNRSNTRAPARFTRSSALSLPFPDKYFDCVVSTDCLEHIAPDDVPKAMAELHRVCKRYMFMQIAVVPDRDGHWHLTIEGREWWERKFFEAGFRKHPAYYSVNGYEALNKDDWQIFILLEKMPEEAVSAQEDYSRITGIESDAHLYKYEWAAAFVRPGDHVYDMAPLGGAGAYLLAHRSEASCVLCEVKPTLQAHFLSAYHAVDSRLSVATPEAVTESMPCDFALCFDRVASITDVVPLINSLACRITPGGRLLLSIPLLEQTRSCDWRELAKATALEGWYLEKSFLQEGAVGAGNALPVRRFTECNLGETTIPAYSELLLVLMRDPASKGIPYRESVYGASNKPSEVLEFARDYRNPWLLRAMVEFPFRARNPAILAAMADSILADEANRHLPDAAAALAIKGYQLLERDLVPAQEVDVLLEWIREFFNHAGESAHLQRWRISLAYLQASLLRKIGRLDAALQSFDLVLSMDWRSFSPTIGTKIVDAAYEAGQLLVSQGCIGEARERWKKGAIIAFDLLNCGVSSFAGDMENPQQFPIIVAVEFLDSATRCIRALRWTAESRALPHARLFEQSRQCWKWMIKERSQSIIDTEAHVRTRDAVIADQDRRLLERWDVLQKLEAMVNDRDQAISNQAEMLEERWSVMQRQDAMIRDRDEAIAAQAKLLEERWAIVLQMEADIRARDREITSLHEQLAAKTGEVSRRQ